MTDDRRLGEHNAVEKGGRFYSLENLKLIGMMDGHGDEKIVTFLSHLFQLTGKNVVHFQLADFQKHPQELEEMLHSHMRTCNDELAYAVIHIPDPHVYPYDFSNISLDSIIHTFLGERYKERNDRSGDVFDKLSAKGYVMINVDDGAYTDFISSLENKLVITYGLSPRATITASSIEEASSLHFTCCVQRGITTRDGFEVDPMEFPVRIPNFGKADIHHALAAIGTGLVYGIPAERIVEVFEAQDQAFKKVKYESR